MKLLAAFSKTAFMAILIAVAFSLNVVGAVALTVTGACIAGVAHAHAGKQFRFSGLQGVLRADIDVSDLVSEFGAFYINQRQNMATLMQAIRHKTVTPSVALAGYTENTIWRRSKSELSSVVQAFQRGWTPKGTLSFKPKSIPLYQMKIDLDLYPDDIVGTWVGFLEGKVQEGKMTSDQARAQWPLIKYMIEMDLLPQKEHDLETKEYYKGEFSEPIAGTAGVTGNSMDGIRKWLTDGLASHSGDGSINELSDWAGVTSSNIFDKAEAVVEELSDTLEDEQLVMCMSRKNVRNYLRDKRNTHGTDINYDENKISIDFYENCKIVGLPSMAGTNDLFITPSKNFRYIRRTNGFKTPKIEENKRGVSIILDWWEGLGFDLNELVAAYVEPQTSGSAS